MKLNKLCLIFATLTLGDLLISGHNTSTIIDTGTDLNQNSRNIYTVFQVLLGQICLCKCGTPNFSIAEFRQNDKVSKSDNFTINNNKWKSAASADQIVSGFNEEGKEVIKNEAATGISNKNETVLQDLNEKLLGGDNLYPNGFPWSSLVIIKGFVAAGGAIISDKHVITAASPLFGIAAGEVKILIGAHNRCSIDTTASNISVTEINIHPAYLITDHRHDIAILTLSSKLSFNKYISLICLPNQVQGSYPPVSWISSWLSPSVPNLLVPFPPPNCVPKVVRLPFLTNDECLRASNGIISLTYEKGCLGPFGARSQICSGDVGSSVQIINKKGRFELFGILISTNNCDVNQVIVYLRVDHHIQWIKNAIKSGCLCND